MNTSYKITLLLLSLSPATVVLAASGRTADGCTYKVINGQYLTDCSKKNEIKEVDTQSIAPPSQVTYVEPTRPAPTSYSDVPMRERSAAPSSAVTSQQSYPSIMPVPVTQPESYQNNSQSRKALAIINDHREYDAEEEKPVGDQTYFSAMASSTSFKESKADSSLGFSLAVGSNFDNHFGIELGYSYAKQGQKLGLASRGNADPSMMGYSNATDANLSAHLLTVETQGHFTGIERKFRPYLGLGLGWKSSTLQEKQQQLNDYSFSPNYGSNETGSLKQTSLGAIASAGLKFRAGKKLFIGISYRYFAPFSRNSAILDNPGQYYSYDSNQGTKLNQGDSKLTGSAQQQFSGGIQFLF